MSPGPPDSKTLPACPPPLPPETILPIWTKIYKDKFLSPPGFVASRPVPFLGAKRNCCRCVFVIVSVKINHASFKASKLFEFINFLFNGLNPSRNRQMRVKVLENVNNDEKYLNVY